VLLWGGANDVGQGQGGKCKLHDSSGMSDSMLIKIKTFQASRTAVQLICKQLLAIFFWVCSSAKLRKALGSSQS
jgi:hypothetical protein